jgi:hypothetical protein
MLHKSAINSPDPHYLNWEEIEQSGYPQGKRGTLCYRTKDDQREYQIKTETLYNVGDIVNASPYHPVSALAPGAYLRAEAKTFFRFQFVEDMAAFMVATKTGKVYVPAANQFAKDNYRFAQHYTPISCFKSSSVPKTWAMPC